eukprot:scaffold62711_cov55-Phaeocystis_antarctica.AAC.3
MPHTALPTVFAFSGLGSMLDLSINHSGLIVEAVPTAVPRGQGARAVRPSGQEWWSDEGLRALSARVVRAGSSAPCL